MRKSKDITKYDIDWQVLRVSLKSLPDYKAKCQAAMNFLIHNSNRGDQERVRNYLEGLSMAYKDKDRAYILDTATSAADHHVANTVRTSLDFSKFTDKELTVTAKDNMVRAKAYLKKGYRHTELIHFLTELYKYLKDTKALETLETLVNDSHKIENTVKFFF